MGLATEAALWTDAVVAKAYTYQSTLLRSFEVAEWKCDNLLPFPLL